MDACMCKAEVSEADDAGGALYAVRITSTM
jgi:hypothetical protein